MTVTSAGGVDQGRAVGAVERDIEQAITALKKGAHLLKYGKRGKPKFCPFRLSNDESALIWLSGKEEKHLKLSHVSRIMPGQRTAIFQRYPRPNKECQSFSLIYNDGSLDLICKDKDEAEVWFAGLKTLISHNQTRKWRTQTRSEGLSSGTSSPRTYTRRSSPQSSPFGSSNSMKKDGIDSHHLRSPYESPIENTLDKAFSDVLWAPHPNEFFHSDSSGSVLQSLSSGSLNSINEHSRGTAMDNFRVSLSSIVSSSSQGSGHDEGDALGDVFIWGEGTGDGILGGGNLRNGFGSDIKMDSLVPKPLKSAVVLDVQNIGCGRSHAAVVTKQGEIYTWGEESGGRLGHGVDTAVSQPKLVDALLNKNVELVACGEHHTCAVTLSGELYTWGDGYSKIGLVGHGNEVRCWNPKRIYGPLDGMPVSSVSCGPWHTSVVMSSGQLFTFGDGTFGALGHGDRTSISTPREVESLRGLRTVRAACGFWHTAAVVEVMSGNSRSSTCSSGKLFTWGDGDKGRLGHGDMEHRHFPTCVAALVDPNFCQVACGHSLTVALSTSGHVYTMGSKVYGILGNPQADGKLPVRVGGILLKNFVEEISCGAYHVAVLTSRTEVYTWGKGANGRLGHGDTDDRIVPTLVDALKDKQVRSVVCGTNFTAAICIHKWVSGVDQSMCTGCRSPFNFKRKRHNCYNCALLFCHSCSSKKSFHASMAPNPNKPYRVCDNCFNKISKIFENDSLVQSASQSFPDRKGSTVQGFADLSKKDDESGHTSNGQISRFSLIESFSQTESKSSKKKKKYEFNSSRVSPIPTGRSQWAALNITRSLNPVAGTSRKFFSASVPGSRIASRATSPNSRRHSPPRPTTPTPTLGGLVLPQVGVDARDFTNESLNIEVVRLRAQVESLTQKAQHQQAEIERKSKQLKEVAALASEESAKCKAAKTVIKSLAAQLKDMAEKLPAGAAESNVFSLLASSNLSHVLSDNLPPSATVVSDLPDVNGSRGPYPGLNQNNMYISEARNGRNIIDTDTKPEAEYVEQDEPGVYITLTSLPGGLKDLKRVRFSRKRFSEKQAGQWWVENRDRVYKKYNISTMDKLTDSIEF